MSNAVITNRFLLSWLGILAVAISAVRFVTEPLRMVLLPLVCLVVIAAAFWRYLALRNHRAPLFEIGSFCVLATLAYAAFPLIWYILSDFQITPLSHIRLQMVDPGPEEFATVGWMYVAYLSSLTLSYAIARQRSAPPFHVPVVVSLRMVFILIGLYLVMQGYVYAVRVMYGVNFAAAYNSELYQSASAYNQLPLLARQVLDWVNGVLVIITCALVVAAIAFWKSPRVRWLLLTWFALSLVDYVLNPGGRFRLLAMILSAILAYDRCVDRIRIVKLALWMTTLLALFLTAGIFRGVDDPTEALDMLGGAGEAFTLFFSVSNEFQISYGSTIELRQLVDQGTLAAAPWQVLASEVLLLVPSQLLPFEKIDPVQWYVNETSDDFFTYGVIAQSILGLGWTEIVLRGILMGLSLALVHNMWAKKPQSFWRNVFYIWLATMVYYTVRNTSYYILTIIVLRFLSLIASVTVIEAAMRRLFGKDHGNVARRNAPGAAPAT